MDKIPEKFLNQDGTLNTVIFRIRKKDWRYDNCANC